jgi:hypothetical protein
MMPRTPGETAGERRSIIGTEIESRASGIERTAAHTPRDAAILKRAVEQAVG